MASSNFRKTPKEQNITKKMLQQKMEEVAQLSVALETTIMEWELWFRLIPMLKEGNTPEQHEAYINDGPIFSDIPSRIMESIRNQMPKVEEPAKEDKKPVLFDGSGNVASVTDKPILKDSAGNIINK